MPPVLVSRDVLAKLRQAVYDHMSGYIAVNFGADLVDPAELERLVIEGVISPEDADILRASATDPKTPLRDAFVTGAVLQRLSDAGRRS